MMENVAHNHVDAATAPASSGGGVNSNRIVSFIVGDEEGNDSSQTQNHNHMNGDALSHEDEEIKERQDNFDTKARTGLDSKSSSYKDMFGLTERRKRLRWVNFASFCNISFRK